MTGADALVKRRIAKREAAVKRRKAAAKARQAAVRASKVGQLGHGSPGGAAAQCALTRILSQAGTQHEDRQKPTDDAVVWRQLSTDAKPLDQWATSKTVATHSHFTPYCQPQTDEELAGEDDPYYAASEDHREPRDKSAVPDSIMGDLLLTLACFIAFPIGLVTSGLPNLAVIVTAIIYKINRRKRFSNGMFALIVVLSLVGLVAGAFRAAQPWLGITPTN